MPRALHSDSAPCLEHLLALEPLGKCLHRLKEHHDDSYEHSLRVALLAIDLAHENRLSDAEVRTVGYAGLLHDLGKVSIEASLLSKPTALNQEEREAVKYHSRLGFLHLTEDFS